MFFLLYVRISQISMISRYGKKDQLAFGQKCNELQNLSWSAAGQNVVLYHVQVPKSAMIIVHHGFTNILPAGLHVQELKILEKHAWASKYNFHVIYERYA